MEEISLLHFGSPLGGYRSWALTLALSHHFKFSAKRAWGQHCGAFHMEDGEWAMDGGSDGNSDNDSIDVDNAEFLQAIGHSPDRYTLPLTQPMVPALALVLVLTMAPGTPTAPETKGTIPEN